MRSLQVLASNARHLLPDLSHLSPQNDAVFAALAQSPGGEMILQQFNQFLEHYGYLSEVGTDIAVPTWKEHPQPVQELFTQFLFNPPAAGNASTPSAPSHRTTRNSQRWKIRMVQQRLDLKG